MMVVVLAGMGQMGIIFIWVWGGFAVFEIPLEAGGLGCFIVGEGGLG